MSHFRPDYVQQTSLSYQLSLGANENVEQAGVDSKGTHMAQTFDLNEPGPATTVTGAASTSNEQARRPYAGIAVLSHLGRQEGNQIADWFSSAE